MIRGGCGIGGRFSTSAGKEVKSLDCILHLLITGLTLPIYILHIYNSFTVMLIDHMHIWTHL